MYDEDNNSEGGSKGSYEIFKAEGDVLFKKEEFQKALASYSTVRYQAKTDMKINFKLLHKSIVLMWIKGINGINVQ